MTIDINLVKLGKAFAYVAGAILLFSCGYYYKYTLDNEVLAMNSQVGYRIQKIVVEAEMDIRTRDVSIIWHNGDPYTYNPEIAY